MAVTRLKAVNPLLLTTDMQTIYTVPAGTGVKDMTFGFLNTDTASAIGIILHFVPSGNSAAITNQFFMETSPNGTVIAPGETREIPVDQAMSAGDSIQVKASITSKVVMHTTVTETV